MGDEINASAEASDEQGDPIEYLWSGSGGVFADPGAASTTYTCLEIGQHDINIAVSDDDFTNCIADWTVTIACVPIPACNPPPSFDEVQWTITAESGDYSGTIDTSAPGSYAALAFFGLPPTTGLPSTITMEAQTPDQQVSCVHEAEFDIVAGETTSILVPAVSCYDLNGACTTEDTFRLDASPPSLQEPNGCSWLEIAVVSPLQTSVGNDIDLDANAQDEEGDSIEYRWTATGGSIADPDATTTTYTCGEVGDHTVTIAVSDDDFNSCVDDWTAVVTCVSGN